MRFKKKTKYQIENETFLLKKAQEKNTIALPNGILYQIILEGSGASPTPHNVVSVYYKGMLINGNVFDDNTQQGYPDAFRIKELIKGWQIILPLMKVGDKWRVYIPSELGYGKQNSGNIPKFSTLIFEIELIAIA